LSTLMASTQDGEAAITLVFTTPFCPRRAGDWAFDPLALLTGAPAGVGRRAVRRRPGPDPGRFGHGTPPVGPPPEPRAGPGDPPRGSAGPLPPDRPGSGPGGGPAPVGVGRILWRGQPHGAGFGALSPDGPVAALMGKVWERNRGHDQWNLYNLLT
jgi:hypothetical protein